MLWIVEYTNFTLLTWLKNSTSWRNCENLFIKNMFFKRLLWSRVTGISPLLQLNLVIIRKLEAPLGVNTTHVLQSECDLSGQGSSVWINSMFARDLTEVPVKGVKVCDELLHAEVRLLRVVELLF